MHVQLLVYVVGVRETRRGASATRARRHEKIENKRNRIVFRLDTTDNHDASSASCARAPSAGASRHSGHVQYLSLATLAAVSPTHSG